MRGICKFFDSFKKIELDVCLYFSYNLPNATELTNDTLSDKNF